MGHVEVNDNQNSAVCPSCKSDEWKSAKMVVMEGTSFTDGRMEGSITDPGMLSGIAEFLLSDRWFSWNYKLDVGVEFSTRSGLVEVVKKFMVAQGELVQMPKMPDKPKKLGFFEKAGPSKPGEPLPPPDPPLAPEMPASPEKPMQKPWYTHFWQGLLGKISILVIGMLIYRSINGEGSIDSQIAIFNEMIKLIASGSLFDLSFWIDSPFWENSGIWLLFIFALLCAMTFYASLRANEDKKEEHENKLESIRINHEKALEKYRAKIEKYNRLVSQHEEDMREYPRRVEEYDRKRIEHEGNIKAQIAEYEMAIKKHEIDKQKVLRVRALLWEKTRVCLRCGNAYVDGSEMSNAMLNVSPGGRP